MTTNGPPLPTQNTEDRQTVSTAEYVAHLCLPLAHLYTPDALAKLQLSQLHIARQEHTGQMFSRRPSSSVIIKLT